MAGDDTGHLAGVTGPQGASTNVYDPDGHLLIERDPGRTTLYLPNGQQQTLDAATNLVSGARYIAMPGGGSVIRTGAGSAYTYALLDPHGTPSLYLDSTTQTRPGASTPRTATRAARRRPPPTTAAF